MLLTWLVETPVVARIFPSTDKSLPTAHLAKAAGPVEATALSSVRLDILPGPAGGEATARLSFDAATNVRGFNLLLQFESGQLLSASAADFQRTPAFFPDVNLGDHSLNSARDAEPGQIRNNWIVANSAELGSAEIGYLRLHISTDAPVDATQTVTLTGEIDQAGSGLVIITPVVATVHVIEMNQRVYLPIILRNR